MKYATLYCKEFKTVNFDTFMNMNEMQHDFQVIPNSLGQKLEHIEAFFSKLIDLGNYHVSLDSYLQAISQSIYKEQGYYNNLALVTLRLLHIFL